MINVVLNRVEGEKAFVTVTLCKGPRNRAVPAVPIPVAAILFSGFQGL